MAAAGTVKLTRATTGATIFGSKDECDSDREAASDDDESLPETLRNPKLCPTRTGELAKRIGYDLQIEDWGKFVQNPVMILGRNVPDSGPSSSSSEGGAVVPEAYEADEDVARGGSTTRALVYLRTGVVAVCVIEPVPPKDRTVCSAPGVCPFSHNVVRTHFVVPDVEDLDAVEAILDNPLQYARERGLGWTRRETLDRWEAPRPPRVSRGSGDKSDSDSDSDDDDGGCALCGFDPAPIQCPTCREVSYCSKTCQDLDSNDGGCHADCVDRSQTDMVRRWQQVAVASGLTSCPLELERIAECCAIIDRVLFEPEAPTILPTKWRHGCGSVCTLTNLLFDIAAEYHEAAGMGNKSDVMEWWSGRTDVMPYTRGPHRGCSHAPAFVEECGTDLDRLREVLVSLQDEVRLEVLMWQFERIKCDDAFVMATEEGMPLHGKQEYFPVQAAHFDYSDLVYSAREVKALCSAHGMYDLSGQGDDDDDDDEDGKNYEQEQSSSKRAKKKKGKKKKSKKKGR